ncbi:ATP-dependent helicase [Thermoactinomyces mirandus]|uniref:DNA 3'-5' helicase n=1 Tax=Thermoactinomyces mirandus TaxID=2756294 RepID=A0A7W1XUJ6_9BACL|nr:ATP-dependent helicase [Thermoactinomyces mirandus]MBA4603549.1 ATP-dependent helicase [Thermoactinomyces mirandus]
MNLDTMFAQSGFTPNPQQERAIKHLSNPLFLIAGPGSGKTRVLLWRTVNLLVFQKIDPKRIFLSTFTEKAAKQLRDGLETILGQVTNQTGRRFNLSKMYIGTVHSLCQRMLGDRRFVPDRSRQQIPSLLDELDQYFLLHHYRFWEEFLSEIGMEREQFLEEQKDFFKNGSRSRHQATVSMISLFNRWSEENLPVEELRKFSSCDAFLDKLVTIYQLYLQKLRGGKHRQADFSLLQQEALQMLMNNDRVIHEFEHIIIDEYQDTNAIQEKIFFRLAEGHKNICVVGDDDQALYRFRGATVENFVQFPQRCQEYLQVKPTEIKLSVNYRSRKKIVDFYTAFMEQEDWGREDGKGFYRLADKGIRANSIDTRASVIASTNTDNESIAEEIALLVKKLLDEKKVADPNQIAFLFSSLKARPVVLMKRALEKMGLNVYAPRATRFFELEEPIAVMGLFLSIFGKPQDNGYAGDYQRFQEWMELCLKRAEELMKEDQHLARYISKKRMEVEQTAKDYQLLTGKVEEEGWDLQGPYDPDIHKQILKDTEGISKEAKKGLGSYVLDRIAKRKLEENEPFTLHYIVNRVSSLDWSVLDCFYRLCRFKYFQQMFELAENGTDEGPIWNLSQMTKYLARYMEQNQVVISGRLLVENRFVQSFFMGFVYSLYRLGETELENGDNPFPKGRIPFLTIHQSKGLEFPVVILGSLNSKRRTQRVEEIVRPMLNRNSEPLEKVPDFDMMRMYYVALSRAENLLVIANARGRGISTFKPFKEMLDKKTLRIPDFDLATLPAVIMKQDVLPRIYSYTSDFLLYQKCPRQYMVFRKYGFVPSRSQTMFFGTLVHKTIEDLHNRLISLKREVKL